MASTGNIQTTQSSDPSSRSEHRWKYQVFLSFSGEARNNFTRHLCREFYYRFINTFKDDERLGKDDERREIGRPIKKELLDAIEKSRMAVVIISKNYASSTWCLEELAKILECMKDREMKVLPIFYHVDTSDVRHQKGTFRDALAEHEKNLGNKDKVQTWRNALTEVANLSGYHLESGAHEPSFVKGIVESISGTIVNVVDDHEDNLMFDLASALIVGTTPSSPSSCSKHRWKYEVFLSFRGETRDIYFTSHLCNELDKKFIHTFKVDDRLEIGRPFKKEFLDEIEKSRMAVIIFSKEYAASTRCLEELVKIVECMKDREMEVLPIFYHVDPSDVRKQEDTFRDAFAEHEKNLGNKDKVQTWRNALKKVANLSGYRLKSGADEPTFIKIIVKWISRKLSDLIDDHDENLVGVDSPVNLMYLHYFAIKSEDVLFIGIVGISGMGKTTLARVIFQKFNDLFQARSFLEDVSFVSKRNGLVALQENLLSDMKLKDDQEKWDVLEGIDVIRNRLRGTKVLIVLDDVDEKEQLETLAGNCNWFGPGSRIIVTSRDEYLLRTHGVRIFHRIKGLDKNEALQLFSQEAFRKPDQCEDQDFLDLCNDYVSYAEGHPLTLKVLGSSLLGKGREVWKSSLNKLKVLCHNNIRNRLEIGFDALGVTEKNMFLDIACFFNGEDKDRVVDLLEDSDCFPNIDIETLMDKSLIKILGRKLRMHSLLQEMGREIVCCEDRDEPGKRSRLWLRDDILKVLRENSGTYKVQGIMLSTSSPHREEDLDPEAFSNMKRLRLIKVCDVNLPLGLNYLSNQLLLMEWHGYSLGSIPESFQPSNLVELIMHRSSFKQLPMAFLKLKKLKVMDFSGSEDLTMTPDFSGCPSLQRIIFKGCTRLSKVHQSIGALKQLILFNLKDCKCLSNLLHEINLESLNRLILSGCSTFDKFPEIGQSMKHLSELYLDGTAIEELPLSIQYLTGLTLLNLGGCKKLLVFPSVVCCLPALKTLILSGCKGQPPSPVLFSIGAPLTLSLPSFISGLTSLVALDLSDCNLLDGALPEDLSGLSSLESLNLSRNNFTRLPESISQLPKLKFLYLDNCSMLQLLPNLPSTIQLCTFRGTYKVQGMMSSTLSPHREEDLNVRCEDRDEPGKRSILWLHDDIREVLRENSGTYKVQGMILSTSSPHREEDLNVHCEDRDEPGKRSRLWLRDDICEVLLENSGTYKVQGMMLSTSSPHREEDLNVRCEDRDEPGKRSRLWLRDDILEVLRENSGTYKVQGMMLSTSAPRRAFLKIKKLGLKKICDVNLPWGYNYLPNRLPLMKWPKYPLVSLPANFHGSNLAQLSFDAALTLSLPSFFSVWTSLVALDLSDCNLLDGALPEDLSGLSSLESLNLSRNNFTRLPESISQLPKLKFLYLDNCGRLQLLPNLPSSIQLVSTRESTSL